MNTFWITFYSYKGGVGRTTALANTAALLAKDGRRVLLIDFDLEAPGLDSFRRLGCEKNQRGVVEYVTEYLETGRAPSVRSFVHECVPDGLHLRGKLWLMSAGKKTEEYNNQLARIDWSDLYEQHSGAMFVENWKADIEDTFAPDYVLIDSRTGLTDIGGICTAHFPQLVVLLFALNDQNIEGIAGVARVLNAAKNTRPPQLLTVATPVPPIMSEKKGILDRRLDFVEQKLGLKPHLMVHYDPRMALEESVVVWDHVRNGTTLEFQQLRDAVCNYDVRGLDFLLKSLSDAIQEHNESRCHELLKDLLDDYSDRVECHHAHARSARAFGKLAEAEQHLRRAVETDLHFAPAFEELLGMLTSSKRFAEAVDVCRSRVELLEKAGIAESRLHVLQKLGEVAMAAAMYEVAVNAFRELCERARKDGGELVEEFNYSEARRRANISVPSSEWEKVVAFYESSIEAGAGSLDIRLNQLQAMHIPYAMLGRLEQSQKLLRQVGDLINAVSPRERLFSVANYQYQSVADFTRWNDEMLSAISSRRLWDGFALPVQSDVSG